MIRTEIVVTKNNFPAIRREMNRNAGRIVREAAFDIEAEAKTRAPVDTGNLKNSIQATRVNDLHWRVVVGAEYGVYIEFGTRFMAAQPFLVPAWRDVLPNFIAAMTKVVR